MSPGASVTVFLLFALGIGGGVGAAIGSSKGRSGVGFVLGFFLGFIGWIIVAVIEPSPQVQQRRQQQLAGAFAAAQPPMHPSPPPAVALMPELRRCPWCAELIQPAAIICRFCNRDVTPFAPAPTGPLPPPQAGLRPTNPERWLPDPLEPGAERLWNGERWTEHVRVGGVHRRSPESKLGHLPPPQPLGGR